MLIIQALRRAAPNIRNALLQLTASLAAASAALLWRFESGRMVISSQPGHAAGKVGSRVVIFAHFDSRGQIREHTRVYLNALKTADLDIVFVTNASYLRPPDLAWISQLATYIVIRRNVGYDFAAWRDAMTVCGLPTDEIEFLLLVNDSVYGPLNELLPILDRINFDEADVWGATDSWQRRFHLQSFFLAFGPRALGHEAFRSFWSSVRNVRSKAWIVSRYEVGLSQSLIGAGLRCKALWPYTRMIKLARQATADRDLKDIEPQAGILSHPNFESDIEARNTLGRSESGEELNTKRILRLASRRAPVNPTADLWRLLIKDGFPFLKRELLRDNPSKVPDIADWLPVVDGISAIDRDIILADLETSLRNKTP